MQAQRAGAALDIKIGSPVRCRDGRAGGVIKLVVEPGSKRVTHLVLEKGWKLTHDVAVPIERIERVEDGWVVLDMSVDELNALPEYAELDYAVPDASWAEQHGYPSGDTLVDLSSAPPAGWLAPAWSGPLIQGHTHLGVPPRERPVGRGTRVTARDRTVGRLDHVLLDREAGAVRALVVRKGHLLAKDVIVPATWVERVNEDEIVLGADQALLERLPEYRPARSDAAITAAVEQALAADPRTRQQKDIAVRTSEGVVHIGGVDSEDVKQAIAEVAGGVEGVLTVEGTVAAAVRDALARDSRTAQALVDVVYLGGGVTLRGPVRTAAEKTAAVEVAKRVPGVVTVIDELEVRPS